MSIPHPYLQSGSSSEPAEDCRDYLRTGRCKYGASCKYNHPSNVQTGGGMKAPIDPTEPLFPVRPNEPVCQYYMKHGTCKFGQTCKFHHPSPSTLAAMVAADGGSMHSDSLRLQWSSGPAATAGGDPGVFQLLPQRPGEPNCIFYLKNGKCKYGATCRYHHPQLAHTNMHVHSHSNAHAHDRGSFGDTAAGTRRYGEQNHGHNQNSSYGGGHNAHVHKIPISHSSRLQYITPLPASAFQHGHFVVSEGAVAFVSLEGHGRSHGHASQQSSSALSPTSSHHRQVVDDSVGGNLPSSFTKNSAAGTSTPTRPLGLSRDLASSASTVSIASSYDTAISAAELQAYPTSNANANDPSTSLWNRFNGSNSNSSNLGSYGSDHGHNSSRGRSHLGYPSERISARDRDRGTGTEGPLVPNMPPGSSNESVSESSSVYHDSYTGNGSSAPLLAPRGVQWRESRSSSFDHTHHSKLPSRHDIPKSMSVPEHLSRGQNSQFGAHGSPPSRDRVSAPRRGNDDDEGLSMMTSALLTMLDTTEEGPSHVEDPDPEDNIPLRFATISPRTAKDRPRFLPTAFDDAQADFQSETHMRRHMGFMPLESDHFSHNLSPTSRQQYAPMYSPNSRRIPEPPIAVAHNYDDRSGGASAQWSPSWYSNSPRDSELQGTTQTMNLVHGQQSSPHDPSHHVGLFLP